MDAWTFNIRSNEANPGIRKYMQMGNWIRQLLGSTGGLMVLVIVVVVVPLVQGFGQTPRQMSEYMVTAQPGFYIGPYTTYPGNFQVENSFIYDRLSDDAEFTTLTIPTTQVRYGIADWLEVRARAEWAYSRVRTGTVLADANAFNAVVVGAKMRITQPGEKLPQVALRAHLRIPGTGSSGAGPIFLAPSLLLATNFPLLQDQLAFVNLGAVWNGVDAQPTYQYAVAMERGIFPQFTAYAEVYGALRGDTPIDHRYDLGAYYAFNPNLQADLSGGVGFQGTAVSWFLSAGLCVRIVPLRNEIP